MGYGPCDGRLGGGDGIWGPVLSGAYACYSLPSSGDRIGGCFSSRAAFGVEKQVCYGARKKRKASWMADVAALLALGILCPEEVVSVRSCYGFRGGVADLFPDESYSLGQVPHRSGSPGTPN